jgi:hypothetical protein
VLRVIAACTGSLPLLEAGGALWVLGFVGFALIYAPLLARHKPAWVEARC